MSYLQNGAAAAAAPLLLQRIPRDGDLPLSFAQERIWFLSQWEPASPGYNIAVAFRLEGALDVSAFERAVNAVVRRHEVLRTTCRNVGGRATLAIAPDSPIEVPVVDLRRAAAAMAEVHRLAREEARRPFDLSEGPLLRVAVLRLDDEDHAILVTTHHFAADGWSVRLLFREIGEAYAAIRAGRAPRADVPAIQYADFARWQRRCVERGALDDQLVYWRRQLAGAPAVMELPTDRPRPAEQRHRGAVRRFTVPPDLRAGLQDLQRREGVTLFMALLAVLQTLLHRYTHQEDVVVGTAVSSRNRVELEGLVGTFANNLVLRTGFGGNPTFRQLLQRVRDVALGAFAHQDVPFERLIEELQPQRDLSHAPLFQVLFLLHQTGAVQSLDLPGATLSPLPVELGTAKFDLSLSMVASADGLTGEVEYDTDLFDPDTIDRLTDHFLTLAAAAVEDPSRPIGALPLLTAQERHQVVEQWNATEAPYPRDRCVHQLFEDQAASRPDAVAVVCGRHVLSYGELNARANRLAHFLRARGVRDETLVGLCVDRSPDMVVGLLGILKAGGAYVPLDPAFPRDRLAFILEDAGAKVLVTQEGLLAGLPEQVAVTVCLDRDARAVAAESAENPLGAVSAEQLAYVIYTSGSTGQPKGVEITHRCVTNFLMAMLREPGLDERDALFAVTTVSFDIAGLELYLPLTVGARVIVASKDVAGDGTLLAGALADSGATVMQATPATWRLLLEGGWQGDPKLKVLCGGEALPGDLADRLLERCGELWNLYGPTETTIWSACHRVRPGAPVVIGRPIANTQLYVLDPYGQPVPVGVTGELLIGGDGVARGYWHRPELTAERFVANPLGGARVYRTGDWVRYRPGGVVEYIGRKDHQVKVRGFRIELGEIEAVLRKLPAVAEAVVVVRELSKADTRLVAYYTVADGEAEPTGTELRRGLRDLLPEYMVPSIFVALEALPLTPNGKVDRRALPEPELFQVQRTAVCEPPRTQTEVALAEIWKELLGIDSVGRSDNFFDLGGHSLLSMRLIYQVEARLGAQLSARDVVLNTLDQLAARCDRATSGNGHATPPQRPGLFRRVAAAIRGHR
jgi:amino acid adenylation domain-containing protein